MQLTSRSFAPYSLIPADLAFGKADPDTGIALAGNQNPHLAWSGAPLNTQSFAIICVDPDAPTDKSKANSSSQTIPVDFPRGVFVHWVLANLPATLTQIEAGTYSAGITPRGKQPGTRTRGGVEGQNSYTQWFEGDPDMAGTYGGYDGPCPPFNDERTHGYHFTVYALDLPQLDLPEAFTADDLEEAMAGHILDQATLIGTYSTRS